HRLAARRLQPELLIVGSDRTHEAWLARVRLVSEGVAQSHSTILRVVESMPEFALGRFGRVRCLRHLRIAGWMAPADGLVVEFSGRELLAKVCVALAARPRLLRRRRLAVLELLVEQEIRHEERLTRVLDDELLVVRLGVLPDECLAGAVG